MSGDDDYATPGRPPCDWDDREAKAVLVDALVRDARAVLDVVDGQSLVGAARDAAELLAVVAGQDVVEGDAIQPGNGNVADAIPMWLKRLVESILLGSRPVARLLSTQPEICVLHPLFLPAFQTTTLDPRVDRLLNSGVLYSGSFPPFAVRTRVASASVEIRVPTTCWTPSPPIGFA